jgi:hypothetical protein
MTAAETGFEPLFVDAPGAGIRSSRRPWQESENAADVPESLAAVEQAFASMAEEEHF